MTVLCVYLLNVEFILQQFQSETSSSLARILEVAGCQNEASSYIVGLYASSVWRTKPYGFFRTGMKFTVPFNSHMASDIFELSKVTADFSD